MLRISETLQLPLEATTSTNAVLGIRGSGKTNTGVVLAEELIRAGQVVSIYDIVGVWWGLRSNAAGDGPGLPVVIMGGAHGDVPLSADSGKFVADLVVEQRFSVVLDMSHFSKTETHRFVADYSERLFQKNTEPLHVFIDEADAFAPQRTFAGQERMLGAIDTLVRRGRAKGVGVTMISQRPAVINKNILSQIQTLFCLQLTGLNDRKVIREWVEAQGDLAGLRDMEQTLPSLPRGEAWVWSPGFLGIYERVQIRARETFDSSATPAVGVRRIEPKVLADVNLEGIRQAMAEIGKPAPAEPGTADAARIAELEASLNAMRLELDREKLKPALVREVRVRHAEIERELTALAELFRVWTDKLDEFVVELADGAEEIREPAAQGTVVPLRRVVRLEPSNELTREPADLAEKYDLGRSAARMLRMLMLFGSDGLTRKQLGALLGLSSKGGTFGNYLSQLRTKGLVDAPITGMIRAVVPVWDDVAGPAERRRLFELKLGGKPLAMLQVLNETHPAGLTRQELAGRVELTAGAGTFGNYLSQLRTLGLVEEVGKKLHVRFSPQYPAC